MLACLAVLVLQLLLRGLESLASWNIACSGPITSCVAANILCLGIVPSGQILRWQTLQTHHPATASAPWALRLPPSCSIAQIRAGFELQPDHGSRENGTIFPGLLQTLAGRLMGNPSLHAVWRQHFTSLLACLLEHVRTSMFRLFQIRCHPPR